MPPGTEEERARVSGVAYDAVRVFVGIGALLYLWMSVGTFLRHRETVHVVFPSACLLLAVGLACCWWALRRPTGEALVRRHALAVAVGIAVLAATIPFLFIVVTERPYPAVGLIVVVHCIAAGIHHRRAFVALLLLCDLGWIATALVYGLDGAAPRTLVTELVMVNVGAVVVHGTSARTARRLDAAREELAELAGTDPLTGLANSRRTLEAGRSMVQRLAPGDGLGVAYLDVDGLKERNDRLGHREGDRLLVAFAGAVRRAVRPGDVVGRLGGDEFVVVAAGCDQPALEELVVRLRQRIAVDGLRASVGSVWVRGPVTDGVTFDDLLDVADRAMYLEKQARRASGEARDR